MWFTVFSGYFGGTNPLTVLTVFLSAMTKTCNKTYNKTRTKTYPVNHLIPLILRFAFSAEPPNNGVKNIFNYMVRAGEVVLFNNTYLNIMLKAMEPVTDKGADQYRDNTIE